MSNSTRVAVFLILILAIAGSAAIVRMCLSSDPRGNLPPPDESAQAASDQTAPATATAPPVISESDLAGAKTDPTQPLGDMQPLQSKEQQPHTEFAPGMTQGAGAGQTPAAASSLPSASSSASASPLTASQAFAPSPVAPPMGVAPIGATPGGAMPAAGSAQPGGDDIVYVTPNGAHYHRAGCSHLKHGAIPMKRREAQARYQPCPVCNP